MLELNDPFWRKLDSPFRSRDIPAVLARLAKSWDQDEAVSLFWGRLYDQESLCGAAYAAVPHLLAIAEAGDARQPRREIALFLCAVVYCAFGPNGDRSVDGAGMPQGLPPALEGWDRKLNFCSNVLAAYGIPARPASDGGRTALPLHEDSPARDLADATDLEKISAIRREFLVAYPAIRALCERTLLENAGDEEIAPYLLNGIAAADGLYDLASVLWHGKDGMFKCPSCDCGYEYIMFGDRIAIYADEGDSRHFDRRQADYEDGSPLRADGFMMPIEPHAAPAEPSAAALLDLASRAAGLRTALLVRAFLGRFRCCKCGAEGPIKAV